MNRQAASKKRLIEKIDKIKSYVSRERQCTITQDKQVAERVGN